MSNLLFTSESVSNGHPDKIADQVSDAILDAILREDKDARVACEVLIKTGAVVLAGEISTTAKIDYESIVRKTVTDIGYNHSDLGFDGNTCAVIDMLGKQSQDIAQGVDKLQQKEQGAGDQGLMFGYASNETEVLMPAPIEYSHRLVRAQNELRLLDEYKWIRPDAKSQVTMIYENGKPVAVDTIVLSTQHSPEVSQSVIKEVVMDCIIKKVIPKNLVKKSTKYHINPTGRFVVGGPVGDAGLTGRKIIVDTYGGMARHGGGAFSGKDPSKVDRSAAYAARYVAKNIVAAGIAGKCEVQLSYAIGVAEPVSISVETFGSSKFESSFIENIIKHNFDLTPYGITTELNLLQPMYQKTASYGHFGRVGKETEFTWERLNKVEQLRQDAGL